MFHVMCTEFCVVILKGDVGMVCCVSLVQWFKCDDAWITKATLEEVLASEA